MDYLNSDQAITLIKNEPEKYQTIESLRKLLSQVDMGGGGDVTIFYSGSYEGISAQSIVKSMSDNGDSIRIIDNTQVAKLINRPEFINAVGRAFGVTSEIEIDIAYNDRTTPSLLNQFFFDAENGLWADASRRFAAETVGEVRTLTANARNGRLYTQIR